MTKSNERSEMRLKLAEAKRAQCFLRLQGIYDMIPKLGSDKKILTQFIAQARLVDQLRSEFIELMDDVNLLNLELDTEYIVNYNAMNAFEDLYCIVKCQITNLDAPTAPSASTARDSSHTCKDESIKIPRIDLPSFDGEIQNFPLFYETFKRVIHENNKLTDSERVHYLFSHLTGKAKSVYSGVIPAAENYKTVWEALIAKYDDKRALATSYLNQLLSMKPVNGPSASNLEKTIDSFAATISAIKQLKLENLNDFIFVHLGLKLLDSDTTKHFEMSIRNSSNMPSYEEFIHFAREQVKILHRTSQRTSTKVDNDSPASTARPPLPRTPHAYVSTQAQESTNPCVMCKGADHSQLYSCNAFMKLTPNDKFNFVKEIHACTNCLNTYHTASKCSSKKTCRKCKGKHHSTLHFDNPKPILNRHEPTYKSDSPANHKCNSQFKDEGGASTSSSVTDNGVASVCTLSASGRAKSSSTEILATAKVFACGRNGKDKIIRCLLDPGSQKHYVTLRCCKNLGLTVNNSLLTSVKGIGGAMQPVRGNVNITFRSRYDPKRQYTIDALVLDEITSNLPTCHVDISASDLFDNVNLADDTWATPGEIDLLIGVKLFTEMLMSGKIMNNPGLPDALETALGYVILGDAPAVNPSNSNVGYFSSVEVGNLVQRFWEMEDLDMNGVVLSAEEESAENIYKDTFKRLDCGRYEVALPFKLNPKSLGDSYKTAERRYLSLERKFRVQPQLKPLYDDVIREHIDKTYLSEVPNDGSDNAFYIPHHAIVREDRTTTKVRVVLDASATTTSGLSLNDILHAGPSLQADLFCILLNLRLFAVAITSDVRQMYLCIDVRGEDRPYQRILYRFNHEETLKVFQYNRVAFGLRSSPYLALRTIKQLIFDEGDKFPLAKEIASRDIYMDDVASSVMDENQAIRATKQLLELFLKGGFQLAKWSSNSIAVLKEIPLSNLMTTLPTGILLLKITPAVA